MAAGADCHAGFPVLRDSQLDGAICCDRARARIPDRDAARLALRADSQEFVRITLNDLKFRWEWDPLRGDLRFQKLIER